MPPPPPTGPNSFIFTYVFTEKHLCRRLAPPPMRVGAPQREILDSPLLTIEIITLAQVRVRGYLTYKLVVSDLQNIT